MSSSTVPHSAVLPFHDVLWPAGTRHDRSSSGQQQQQQVWDSPEAVRSRRNCAQYCSLTPPTAPDALAPPPHRLATKALQVPAWLLPKSFAQHERNSLAMRGLNFSGSGL